MSRHSFATLALEKGMPIESVSKILGHTKITTTQIYAKVTTEKLERDISVFGEKMERSFKNTGI
jgi:site-specific recombinase XerD